jgi:hypothetical protein
MTNNLTEADEAEHYITYQNSTNSPRTVRAAYVTTEDKHPDMLAFKDHRNRTVLLVSRESVLAVERLDPEGSDVRTPIAEGGFETTSQTMRRAGINPQEMP